MLDESEIYVKEFTNSLINLYKLCIEDMGYDMGYTNNEIEYRNYLVNNPIHFSFYNNTNNNSSEDSKQNLSIPDSTTDDIPADNIPNEINMNASIGKLTVEKLCKIFKKGKKQYIAACLSAINKYGNVVGLTDRGKLYILAQFAHESGNFIYTAELGKGKGRKYGRPVGPYNKIYYGRGPIQITWDYNYKAITEKYFPKIGINADIYKDPDLCERNLEIGCAASLCWFMMPGNGKRAISAANAGDVRALSKAINGGYNGLQDRIQKTNQILQLANS